MATSVVNDRDKYSELFLKVAKWAALVTPVLVVAYGLLIGGGYVPQSPVYNPVLFLAVCTLFVLIAPIQFTDKRRGARILGLYLVIYHVLGGAYLLWGAGFDSPLTMCWLMLIVVSDLLFGRRAIVMSALFLTAIALILFGYELNPSPQLALQYLAYVLITIMTGAVVSRLRSVQKIEHSDLKRSQEQEELQRGQLMTLINSVGVAIISTSSNGTIRIYNAALLSLLDTNESLSGKKIDDVFHLYDMLGEPISLIEIMKKSGRSVERDDISHRFSDGEEIKLGLSCAPIRGQFSSSSRQHEGYIFILRDISRAKSLEEERNEFISVVSHELRTPITIAEGTISNLQLLLERGDDPRKLGAALKESHEQILYLASMVNDLSTLSRAERGVADEPEEIDVHELVTELYHRYQKRASAKKLSLDIDASPKLGTVLTSRLYLEEILQNFLTNSIKYTEKGGVKLIVRRDAKGVSFAVKDTGIGMSKADTKHIFEKFYRSEDFRTRETAGTGLGLYVVQKLSQKLGIQVDVESRLNHGSTFSFILPLTPPTESGPKHSDA